MCMPLSYFLLDCRKSKSPLCFFAGFLIDVPETTCQRISQALSQDCSTVFGSDRLVSWLRIGQVRLVFSATWSFLAPFNFMSRVLSYSVFQVQSFRSNYFPVIHVLLMGIRTFVCEKKAQPFRFSRFRQSNRPRVSRFWR
jgi:hypothetical protein